MAQLKVSEALSGGDAADRMGRVSNIVVGCDKKNIDNPGKLIFGHPNNFAFEDSWFYWVWGHNLSAETVHNLEVVDDRLPDFPDFLKKGVRVRTLALGRDGWAVRVNSGRVAVFFDSGSTESLLTSLVQVMPHVNNDTALARKING
jgi:hypothetical protein